MNTKTRGAERERSLDRSIYFSESYFSMPQLCSFAHQINSINAMKPKSAIEIGLGNGFVSTFLDRMNVPVTTADINPALSPDICAPLDELKTLVSKKYDLVICCEVLEHMPLEKLDENIDHLRSLGERLFMTLPNSYRTWGVSGLSFLPKLGVKMFDFNLDIPWKRPIAGGPHFWEVGYSKDCSRKSIVGKLEKRYSTVKSGRFSLNPYHVWFVCE